MIKYRSIELDVPNGTIIVDFDPPVEKLPMIRFTGATVEFAPPATIMPTFAKDQSYISELDRKALKQSWLGTWLTANNYTVKLIELVDDVYFAGFVLLENGKIEADRPVHYNKQGNPYNFDTEQYGKLMRRLDTEASYAESINKHT